MKIFDVQQGTEEWLRLRLGRPTASEFKRIVTSRGKFSKAADRYIDQLLGEKDALYLPERAEMFTSRAQQHGSETENEARRWFALETGLEIIKVGFVTTDDGRTGCSPDGFVSQDGVIIAGLELKCPEPAAHMRWRRLLANGIFPPEHLAQVHGGIVVCGLPTWHFVSYCPGLEPVNVAVTPNEFTDELRVALEMFHMRLEEVRNALLR